MKSDRLGIARNTLFKIRLGVLQALPRLLYFHLARAFDTTPQLWLNLQQAYDLWIEEHEHKRVEPIGNGVIIPLPQNIGMTRSPYSKI